MSSPTNSTATEGAFSLDFESTTGACRLCSGLPTLRVSTKSGVIGYVVADWPWDVDIPDDPSQHPDTPHYVVEWFAQDCERKDILGIPADNPYFIARAIHDRHQQGL